MLLGLSLFELSGAVGGQSRWLPSVLLCCGDHTNIGCTATLCLADTACRTLLPQQGRLDRAATKRQSEVILVSSSDSAVPELAAQAAFCSHREQ